MPFNNLKLKIKGFSLIELLLSIALIGLVTAVALPNLRNFNTNQEIDAAASQLVNILKNAQSSASSHVQCPAGESVTSWQVDLNITGGNDSYSLISNCLTLGPKTVYTSPFASTPTSQATFNGGTDLCSGENASIYFSNTQVSYQCASALVPVIGDIRITLSKPGITPKVVVVESGGVIRIE